MLSAAWIEMAPSHQRSSQGPTRSGRLTTSQRDACPSHEVEMHVCMLSCFSRV